MVSEAWQGIQRCWSRCKCAWLMPPTGNPPTSPGVHIGSGTLFWLAERETNGKSLKVPLDTYDFASYLVKMQRFWGDHRVEHSKPHKPDPPSCCKVKQAQVNKTNQKSQMRAQKLKTCWVPNRGLTRNNQHVSYSVYNILVTQVPVVHHFKSPKNITRRKVTSKGPER